MISITSYYGESASAENNAKVIKIDGISLYFSYETLVAVNTGKVLKVIQNYWGPTTGKHLNNIDGGTKEAKDARLSQDDFNQFVENVKITAQIQI